MKTTEQTLYEMMTENTGSALCDSGDAYGRHHERNSKLSIDDFNKQPVATMEFSLDTYRDGKRSVSLFPTINIWHKLNNHLHLDDICREFNAMECDVWNGEYYGTNADQCLWLEENGFTPLDDQDAFNTYNWDCCFSQVLQGQFLEHEASGETYVLLQIHNGCDVRGGYTNAKLFSLNTSFQEHWALINDTANFWCNSDKAEDGSFSIDYMGGNEFINPEGTSYSDEELLDIADKLGLTEENNTIVFEGALAE